MALHIAQTELEMISAENKDAVGNNTYHRCYFYFLFCLSLTITLIICFVLTETQTAIEKSMSNERHIERVEDLVRYYCEYFLKVQLIVVVVRLMLWQLCLVK